jgi:exodeoxyribonuclease VII small subunit
MSKSKLSSPKSFTDAMQALDVAVNKLKTGQLPLEDALTAFEEGVSLIQYCQTHLSEVKGKVEVLTQSISDSDDEEYETEDFYEEEEEEEE